MLLSILTIVQLYSSIPDYGDVVKDIKTFIHEKNEMIIAQSQKPLIPKEKDTSNYVVYIATAYNLSQCGKDKSHKWYGITANGTDLKNKNIYSKDKYIAVDPKRIKLGSRVYIKFDNDYAHLNGIYHAVDTGGGIKNNRIDIYFGEDNVSDAMRFGKRKVRLYVL